MNKSQQARLDALHRTRDYLNTNDSALGTVNKSTSRGALDEVLAGLEVRASAQTLAETNAASATANKNALREDLRVNHMQPIAAIGCMWLTRRSSRSAFLLAVALAAFVSARVCADARTSNPANTSSSAPRDVDLLTVPSALSFVFR